MTIARRIFSIDRNLKEINMLVEIKCLNLFSSLTGCASLPRFIENKKTKDFESRETMPKGSCLAYTIVILDRMIPPYLKVKVYVDSLRHQNPTFSTPNTNFRSNCKLYKFKNIVKVGSLLKDYKRSDPLNAKW